MSNHRDPSLPVEQRVAALLAQMTDAEKAAQTNQVHCEHKMQAKVREQVAAGQVGSRILAGSHLAGSEAQHPVDLAELNAVQRIAVEQTRLGIPLLDGRDVIHGFRTIFPVPLAQAATFNPEIGERCAAAAAVEARAAGVHWTFSPMVDIARDPRWGRCMEGAGEDPYLGSLMARAAVAGYQGRAAGDLADGRHVLACAKHFAGYGSADGGRDYDACDIGPVRLRNLHLPPFLAAVEAGVGTLMSGFHDVDGDPVSGSAWLTQGVLRGEWKFQGFVISDWASVEELIHHRVAADRADAARIGLNAGVDMDMASLVYHDHAAALVADGRVPRAQLDASCSAILAAKFRLGLFEQPYTDPAASSRVPLDAHRALAREAAAACCVLLKDSGVLPLRAGARVALVGPYVHDRRTLLGSWAPDGRPLETASLAEAFTAALPAGTVDASDDDAEIAWIARRADVVVLTVGESWRSVGENNCVAHLELPARQRELVRRCKESGKPVVLAVLSGRPLALPEEFALADAVVWAWHGGSGAAAGLADVLTGAVPFQGRLPMSLPWATGQVPITYNRPSTGKAWAGAGWYRDCPAQPLRPFGHGLTGSVIAYETPRIERTADGVRVRCIVRNVGPRPAIEIAQCYLQDRVAAIARPVRELCGVQRLHLAPGASAEAVFAVGPRSLGFWRRDGTHIVEPGAFRFAVGSDSDAAWGAEIVI